MVLTVLLQAQTTFHQPSYFIPVFVGNVCGGRHRLVGGRGAWFRSRPRVWPISTMVFVGGSLFAIVSSSVSGGWRLEC